MSDDTPRPESAQPNEPVPARRSYTPEEIAAALAHLEANHGNVKRTARERDMPEATLRLWDNGQRRARDVSPELCAAKRAQLTRGFDKLALRAVRQCLKVIGKASARDAAVVAGIATEKGLLLRGESTNITEHRDDSRRSALEERYGASRTVLVVEPHATGAAPRADASEPLAADGPAEPPEPLEPQVVDRIEAPGVPTPARSPGAPSVTNHS